MFSFRPDERVLTGWRSIATQMPSPEPLRIASQTGFAERKSVWMVDLRIQRHNDLCHFSNVTDWWRLPRLRSAAAAFVNDGKARVEKHGMLSLVATGGELDRMLHLPEDPEFFGHVLRTPGFPISQTESIPFTRVGPYGDWEESDKGRYLFGVLELFGGFNNAVDVLSNRFWQSELTTLADPVRSSQDRTALVNKLKKKFPTGGPGINLDAAHDVDTLHDVLAGVARGLRNPRRFFQFQDLQARWERSVDDAIAASPALQSDREAVLEDSRMSLSRSLAALCQQGVIDQAHRFSCSSCGYENWRSIAECDLIMNCEICNRVSQFSPTSGWSYRLNSFISDAIREHGVLAQVSVLGKIARDVPHEPFYFSPPVKLFPADDDDAAPEELDLLCIRSGELIVGEVKTRSNAFTPDDITKLAAAAKRLNASLAVLGCVAPSAPQLEGRANELRQLLAGTSCRVEVISGLNGMEGDWYLPEIS